MVVFLVAPAFYRSVKSTFRVPSGEPTAAAKLQRIIVRLGSKAFGGVKKILGLP
jgi:hypothetical protein